jgi:hypothetical protein
LIIFFLGSVLSPSFSRSEGFFAMSYLKVCPMGRQFATNNKKKIWILTILYLMIGTIITI